MSPTLDELNQALDQLTDKTRELATLTKNDLGPSVTAITRKELIDVRMNFMGLLAEAVLDQHLALCTGEDIALLVDGPEDAKPTGAND